MKLNEIVAQAGFLKSESAIKEWVLQNTNLSDDEFNIVDGVVNVIAELSIKNNVRKLRVQFGTVDGDVVFGSSTQITSLKGMPQEILGKHMLVLSYASGIKTLEYSPKCDTLDASSTGISRIEDVFPHLKGPMSILNLDGCNIESLVGIADMVKFPVERFEFASAEHIEGGIGLLLVPGLTSLTSIGKLHGHNGFSIIEKYLGRPDDIFECQAELIENGFEHNAVL